MLNGINAAIAFVRAITIELIPIKTVDFSAVLNFLCVPLDFLTQNSYYLSAGSNSLSFGFGLRQT